MQTTEVDYESNVKTLIKLRQYKTCRKHLSDKMKLVEMQLTATPPWGDSKFLVKIKETCETAAPSHTSRPLIPSADCLDCQRNGQWI